LRPLLGFTRYPSKKFSHQTERLKVKNIVEETQYKDTNNTSFGKNGKRPPSTIGILLLTKGMMRKRVTKNEVERPRPSRDIKQ
jgi:hypothetical protein